ncbi:MAG: caspase family protein [Planctomycetaceae bacterium]|nr:caspase family protein [Planctomycetaceae bacterium]
MTLAAHAAGESTSTKHALLVGCSRYPHLNSWFELRGPVNDVVLFKKVLSERYRFPRGQISILAAHPEAKGSATRSNIEQEFKRLAKEVGHGDDVVILLCGHGSQQPDDDPENPNDIEPDGRDEIFLPEDVKGWDGTSRRVENAISDDELNAWLWPIAEKAATVWVILDACCSGTGIRGTGGEVARQIPVDELIPIEELRASDVRAGDQSVVSSDRLPSVFEVGARGVVATYAAQPHETTPERLMPYQGGDRIYHGLLSYTLCELLQNAQTPMTYRELVQAIHRSYVARGRTGPTPLIEGPAQDRVVLGMEEIPRRSQIVLTAPNEEPWSVNVGSLHGLTAGSILEVYPPAGSANAEQLLGHVVVVQAAVTKCEVKPTGFGKSDAVQSLPDGGRCRVTYIDFGDQRLHMMVDKNDVSRKSVRPEILTMLNQRVQQSINSDSPVAIVNDPAAAQWFLRWNSGGVRLVPADGATDHSDAPSAIYQEIPIDEHFGRKLQNRLARVARAQGLVRMASGISESTHGHSEGVQIDLFTRDGSPMNWESTGLNVRDGDQVLVRLHNAARHSMDVTLLYVDSDFGVSCLFPTLGEFNRLAAGESQSLKLVVNATTSGLEHMIAIGVRSRGQVVDFTALEQPSLERVARESQRGGAHRGVHSPLGQVLQSAMFGVGGQRGVNRRDLLDYSVRVQSWHIQRPQ